MFNRTVLGFSVLLIWLGAIGWLVNREYFREEGDILAEATSTISPGATYYSVSLGSTQIGFSSSTVDTLPDGFLVNDFVELQMEELNGLAQLSARTVSTLDNTLSLTSFQTTLRGDGVKFVVNGETSGDSLLSMGMASDLGPELLRLRRSGRRTVFPSFLPLKLKVNGSLKAGRTQSVTTFDPRSMRSDTRDLIITGDSTFILPDSAVFDSTVMRWIPETWDTVHAWRTVETRNGWQDISWVDDQGRVVMTQLGNGIEIKRSNFEIVYENFRRREIDSPDPSSGSFVRMSLFRAGASQEAPNLDRMVVLNRGMVLPDEINGGAQTSVGDTLFVAVFADEVLATRARLPNAQRNMFPFRQTEPMFRSDDTRIGAQARRVIGRARGGRAARLLTDWVSSEISVSDSRAGASAFKVLEAGTGNVSDHAILFVSLARSVGLPARTSNGLIYRDGRFYYHTWAEVFVDEWVAVDPTLGQAPADASHIRFGYDGLGRQLEMIRLIGTGRLEVVSTTESR